MERLHHVGGWVTLIGAAEVLGATRWAVYQRLRRYHLPFTRVGGVILIRQADLPLLEKRRG